MPKAKKNLTYQKSYKEAQVLDALKAVKFGMSVFGSSKKYGVPRSTLRYRLRDKFEKTTPGPAPLLGVNVENNIVEWIIDCNEKGFPRKKENILASIKKYLDENQIENLFVNNMPGTKSF